MANHLKLQDLVTTTLTVMLCLLSVSAQPGFLSIDCGGKRNYTDPKHNITWVTDEGYIHNVGRTAQLTDAAFAKYPDYLKSVRYFPKPLNKSCYQLPVTPSVTYLLRTSFFFGNYSGKQKVPSFDFTLETKGMLFQVDNLTFRDATDFQPGEFVLISLGHILHVCLIRGAEGDDPFISAIELRPLQSGMYTATVKPGTLMYLVDRYDMGAKDTSIITRYPQDRFDRIWYPYSIPIHGTMMVQSKNSMMNYKDNTMDHPPSAVMRTALVTDMNSNSIQIQLDAPFIEGSYVVLLYFAEIGTLNASGSRIFNISVNEMTRFPSFKLNDTVIEEKILPINSTPILPIDLATPFGSSRGPIINALEQYFVTVTEPATASDDVAALALIGKSFDMEDWISDPCFGIPWDGIKCDNSTPVRVLEINLAARNLSGSVPPSIGQLTALRKLSLNDNHLTGNLPDLSKLTNLDTLHLQNNNLSGPLPEWLSKLNNLRDLFIDNNSFSDVIPQGLWERHSSNVLNLSYSGNPNLSTPKSKNNKKNKIVLGTIIGGLLPIGLVLVILIAVYRKKFHAKENADTDISGSKSGKDFTLVEVPSSTKSRAFSLEEMNAATKNFSQKIGQGGFGSVYLGKLPDGRSVAVKVLSMFSRQGVAEFLNEVDLLSRIHHKNLVSLLGYCNESREPMLVYQYMSGGSLKDRLYGSTTGLSKLDWKRRLKIALDAAQGLEYLHVGCTPKIIHRDVKTANILLDDILTGKLSDLGLSRITLDDGSSHVTTAIKGTPGYVDPEYFSTQMLTEKSDVYSFGVVLFEIVCGRQPINVKLSEDQLNLVRWATPYVENEEDPDKLVEIIDKTLQPYEYDLKSVSHVTKLAMRCVQNEPSLRPTISEVVAEIRIAVGFQADSTPAVTSQELDIEYNDSQASPVCTSLDSSAPREGCSTESSYNTIGEARKLPILP